MFIYDQFIFKVSYESRQVSKLVFKFIRLPNFVAVAKLIPDNPSREIVKQAFNIIAGSEPFTKLAENLPPSLCNCTTDKVDSTNWTRAQTWIEWWTRPQILKKLLAPWILMTGMSCLELTIQLNL